MRSSRPYRRPYSLTVAIFSTQNSQPVSVSFFVWNFQASLAIVVFLSVICGLVLGVLALAFLG